ncbi:hypothetical protein FRB95_013686 [Tulasnella sp. JGI-2019a]|nr:hypothetical protein FRB93_000689 [Tulasnella sp. JGI-2019a]KAG9034167.1 hypothetical protein FRB95_013686 [Tulasnella sp. JGI-2019a]
MSSSKPLSQLLRRYATAAASPSKRSMPLTLPPSALKKKSAVAQANGRSRDPERPFPSRKAHIYAQYTRLITSPKPIVVNATSSPSPTTSEVAIPQPTTRPRKAHPPTIVLISHENFTAAHFIKVRSELATATAKLQLSRDRIAAAKLKEEGATATPEARLEASFQVLRPGLFLPVVRKASGNREAKKLKRILKGPIAALVFPGTLDPPLLTALLRVVDRIAPPQPKTEAKTPERRGPSEDEFEKKAKPIPVPKMEVVGAYVDGKVVYKAGVRQLAKLPGLKELQAQIVGVLSAPSSKIAGVLGQAAGGSLARTLEGFKKGLEMGAEVNADTPVEAVSKEDSSSS